jgi:predicted cupin superfamily sugar epimerase
VPGTSGILAIHAIYERITVAGDRIPARPCGSNSDETSGPHENERRGGERWCLPRWLSKEASLMARRPSADDLKRLWNLSVMPTEKVYFTQSYVDEKTGSDGKPLCSAIVALVSDDPSTFSDMHRLPTDEIWHFYLGDPIELLLLHTDGRDELVVLGQEVLAGQEVQHVVPAGTWMGARLRPGGEYGVFGNTMAPGFVLSDFEGADAGDLIARWPHRADLIRALTR